jgi:hypothetical protein
MRLHAATPRARSSIPRRQLDEESMNDAKRDRLGDPQEFKLLEDLGRWVRDEEASRELVEPAFQPMAQDRAEALIERLLGPERAAPAPAPIVVPVREAAANDPGRLRAIVGYAATAAAIVGTFFAVKPRTEPDPARSIAAREATSVPAKPSIGSVRLDGGGPLPAHQGPGDPRDPTLLCLGRPMQLTLAATMGQRMDPVAPLEVTLDATPPWGSSHRFVFDIGHDDRFEWVDGGQALVFRGPLEHLAPLTPGPWTLQLSAGMPGACSHREDRSGCLSMSAQTIEVISRDACDGGP